MEKHLLEINLISAQGLKPVNGRKLQTYAIAWVDPTTKLRTRVDRVGGENPVWIDKFIFRVTEAFLASDTSAVSVEIYAVGYIKDSLVGTVRFLINNSLHSAPAGTPAFSAVQIRRPSGRFYGVLNVAATVIDSSNFAAVAGTATAAIGYRDLLSGSLRRRGRRGKRGDQSSGGESFNSSSNSRGESADYSDGTDSTTSSSSSAASTALKEWNGVREAMKSDGLGLLCGLALQKKIQLTPSDRNFQCFTGPENEN